MIDALLRKKVIRQIVDRQSQNRGLSEQIILKENPELHQLACEQFGAWDTALQYAGVNLRSVFLRQNYTNDQVIQKIRQHCRKGYKPTVKLTCGLDYQLQRAATRHFGSWRQALVAAGVNVNLAGLGGVKPRKLGSDEIVDALRKWSEGHSLRWRDICLENRILAVAAHKKFHSWRRVLAAISTENTPPPVNAKREWNKQSIIDEVLHRKQEGKSNSYRVVRQDDSSLLTASIRQFGSWRRALTASEVAAEPSDKSCPSNVSDGDG